MGILRLFYVSLHFIVTYLHYFHVAFSELIQRLLVVLIPVVSQVTRRSSLKSPAHLGINNNDDNLSVMQSAGSQLKQIGKLPVHVSCVFAEPEPDVGSIVSILRWCRAAGIPCISLYDHRGTNSQLITPFSASSLNFCHFQVTLSAKRKRSTKS